MQVYNGGFFFHKGFSKVCLKQVLRAIRKIGSNWSIKSSQTNYVLEIVVDVTKKLHKPCLWLIEPRTFVGIGDALDW